MAWRTTRRFSTTYDKILISAQVWTPMLKGFFPAPVRALLPRRLFKTPAEGAATVILACVDDAAGTYYMDDQDRPTAASPECSATGALVDELGALGLNIR